MKGDRPGSTSRDEDPPSRGGPSRADDPSDGTGASPDGDPRAERPRGIEVGSRVGRARQEAELNLSRFSREVRRVVGPVRGTSRTALRNLEQGRVDSPRKEVVEAIAQVLGVDERWLWTGRRLPTLPAPGAAEPVLPPVPDDDPVWTVELTERVAAQARLASAPPPVRDRFWALLRRTAAREDADVRDAEDVIELARGIEEAVLRPFPLLGLGDDDDGRLTAGTALLLDTLSSLLDQAARRPRSHPPEGATPSPDPPDPPSVRPPSRSRRSDRRHHDGLTWRLI